MRESVVVFNGVTFVNERTCLLSTSYPKRMYVKWVRFFTASSTAIKTLALLVSATLLNQATRS